MGGRGFRLSDERIAEMKSSLDIADGNKDYGLSLRRRFVAKGVLQAQREAPYWRLTRCIVPR